MAVAVSKAKAIPRWPAAMAASLSLHLAAFLLAISDGPHRPRDPTIEVEVLPVHVEVPPPAPPELVKADMVPRGGEVMGKRRGPVVSKMAVGRPVRPTTGVVNEAKPAEPAPEASPAPGPASAESVVVARAEPSASAAPQPGPVAAPRVGSPRTVSPAVGDGLLAIDPNDGRYQPIIPQPLRKPGTSFLSRLKFCVGADGSVDKVTVVTSSEPALDNAILEKARLYRFNPYFDQGRAIPFCFYREYRLTIRE